MENIDYLKSTPTSWVYGNILSSESDNKTGDNLIESEVENPTLTVMLNAVRNISVYDNNSNSFIDKNNDSSLRLGMRDPYSVILPITICYLFIFVAGVLGNVITCIVIAKNKTMHTATNYYLFNLAVSDFLVLIFGKFSSLIVSIYYDFKGSSINDVMGLRGLGFKDL
jgi:hypothetical protein